MGDARFLCSEPAHSITTSAEQQTNRPTPSPRLGTGTRIQTTPLKVLIILRLLFVDAILVERANWGHMQHQFYRFTVIASCLMLSQSMFARERSTSIHVSATVPARVRWVTASPNAVTVGVTMYPNASARVWAAKDDCGAPTGSHSLAESGIHQVAFTPAELEGTNLFCTASSDGVLQSSTARPH